MKKFLQAVDGAALAAPAVDSTDIKKFLSVVSEAEINQPDPKYIEYAQLMAKYDMLVKEMQPDNSGVEKGASPDAIAEIDFIKTKAEQLAGPNLQAWEQARQKENADSMARAQAKGPALAAQFLEDTSMNKLLLIVTEGKGPGNKLTSAETMVYMNTPKLEPVVIKEGPSIRTYLQLVEAEQVSKEDVLRADLEAMLNEVKEEPAKPRNFVAKNAKMGGAGAHKDKKKAEKQGDAKHKAKSIPMDESEIEERSVSQAQAHIMAAAAHNPEFAKKAKIKQSVAKEFNRADKGKNVKSLPQRVVKKETYDEGDE